MSRQAVDLAASIARPFEGLYLKPYICPGGVPTIGYGATRYPDGRRVAMTDMPITKERAEELLMWELNNNANQVMRLCPVLIDDTNRLAAITDFVFNCGAGRLQASTLRRRINQQDWTEARRELMRWVRGGGRILPGLVRRRKAEAALI